MICHLFGTRRTGCGRWPRRGLLDAGLRRFVGLQSLAVEALVLRGCEGRRADRGGQSDAGRPGWGRRRAGGKSAALPRPAGNA